MEISNIILIKPVCKLVIMSRRLNAKLVPPPLKPTHPPQHPPFTSTAVASQSHASASMFRIQRACALRWKWEHFIFSCGNDVKSRRLGRDDMKVLVVMALGLNAPFLQNEDISRHQLCTAFICNLPSIASIKLAQMV